MPYNTHSLRGPRLRPLRRSTGSFPWVGVLIGLAILALIVTPIIVERAMKTTVTFTVTDKSDQSTKDGHKYMIFTNKGVYKDTDTWAFFKFNSSDVYGQLQKGHTYKCDVTGVRIPILSSNKNIISCDEVK